MKGARPFRIGVLITLGVVLAAVLGAQSTGIALTKKAPSMAVAVFPLDGLAYENIASAIFLATTEATGSPDQGAQAAKSWALKAYRLEPLVPKAHAILALAEDDRQKRKQMLDAALVMNRREPRLQAVVLQEQVVDADYPGAIASLDRILRVRPSQYNELFPILISVFAQEGSISEFAKILDGSSDWHARFIRYAANQPSALENLAILRSQMSFDDRVADRRLLYNLVRNGEVATAFSLYERIAKPSATDNIVTWATDYPPFDWRLTDETGLRAQPSLSGENLEISVKPGKGGVVARRLIRAPGTPFSIIVDHSIDTEQTLEDIDIVVRCPGENRPILEASLDRQGNGYRMESLPPKCNFFDFSLKARAWSGRSTLREHIEGIRVVRH